MGIETILAGLLSVIGKNIIPIVLVFGGIIGGIFTWEKTRGKSLKNKVEKATEAIKTAKVIIQQQKVETAGEIIRRKSAEKVIENKNEGIKKEEEIKREKNIEDGLNDLFGGFNSIMRRDNDPPDKL